MKRSMAGMYIKMNISQGPPLHIYECEDGCKDDGDDYVEDDNRS